jgi:3-oxoacyl-ACP reductase-like protein
MKQTNAKSTAVPALGSQTVPVPAPGEIRDEVAGEIALSPSLTAASVIDKFHLAQGLPGGVDVVSLAGRIERAAEAIRAGDLAEIEALLLAQAHALNSVFVQYALRSAGAATQDRASELLLLAMKAQAGSRATLSTLVDLKVPRTTLIAKQANLAQGHQQVNNAAPTPAPVPPVNTVPALALGNEAVVLSVPRARTRKLAERTIQGRK